jgi:hypothetical protein
MLLLGGGGSKMGRRVRLPLMLPVDSRAAYSLPLLPPNQPRPLQSIWEARGHPPGRRARQRPMRGWEPAVVLQLLAEGWLDWAETEG